MKDTGFSSRFGGPALAGIVLLALILRLPGLRLGLPEFCVEDEAQVNAGAMRMIGNLSLDPGTQKYPALMFELTAAADLIEILAPQARAVIHLESFESFRYWIKAQTPPLSRSVLFGRLLSLALGIISLLLFYHFVRLHADSAAALLATLLLAVAPVHQWLSGLLKPEMLLLLCVLLSIHASYRLGAQGRTRDYALGAVALGLALAVKFYFLAAAPLLAGAALAGSARSRTAWLRDPRFWGMLLGALLVFALLSPYTFIHWRETLAWLKLESLNQAGAIPFFKRTTGRLWHAPGLFILTSVLPLALGIPLYLAALAGLPDLWRLPRPAKVAWGAYGGFFFVLYSLGSTLGLTHYYLTFAAVFCLAGGLRIRRGLAGPSRLGRMFWASALLLVVVYNSALYYSFSRAEARSVREASDFLLDQVPASAQAAALVPYHADPARFPAHIKFYPFYQLTPRNLAEVHPEFLVLHQGTFLLAADNPENQETYYFTYLELEAGRLGYHRVWQKTEHFFQERIYGFLMPDALNAFSFAAYQRNQPAGAP